MTEAVERLLARAAEAGDKPAFVEAHGTTGYSALVARVEELAPRIAGSGIGPGTAVLLFGDFGAEAAAWLLALWRCGATVAPKIGDGSLRSAGFADTIGAEWIVDAAQGTLVPGPGRSGHDLLRLLESEGAPGLVIFTSGTSGHPKAVLHDARRLLRKYEVPGKDLTTLAFLLFDHIAGQDTLLYCLANGSTIVCPQVRTPSRIAELIEAHRVQVLPSAPSFLNLLMLSGAADKYDLSSLRIITYGAEMMPQHLLDRLAATFPAVRLVQKYGTSETGAPRSRSQESTSRWIDLGLEETDWRIRDGILELPGTTAMLGYLNAPSPFKPDGWYVTGDRVERKGRTIRFLGRDSDVINVGGEKVFPAEVEAAICGIEGIAEAAVSGRSHPLMGSVVCARIRALDPSIPVATLRARVRSGLSGQLEPFKIPQKIEVTREALVTARFKQKR